jgi:hypothetical protein
MSEQRKSEDWKGTGEGCRRRPGLKDDDGHVEVMMGIWKDGTKQASKENQRIGKKGRARVVGEGQGQGNHRVAVEELGPQHPEEAGEWEVGDGEGESKKRGEKVTDGGEGIAGSKKGGSKRAQEGGGGGGQKGGGERERGD